MKIIKTNVFLKKDKKIHTINSFVNLNFGRKKMNKTMETHDLPAGHQPVENGNPENCPFLQIKKNVDEKMDKNNEKTIKPNDKDSDSELSDDENQGTQGSCPFMPTFKKRNPDLEHLSEGYEYETFQFLLI